MMNFVKQRTQLPHHEYQNTVFFSDKCLNKENVILTVQPFSLTIVYLG